MTSFLMQYDRRTGDLEVTEFAGERAREDALAARIHAELSRASSDVEVVVLTADSLDELRHTHGRYFRSASDLIRDAFSDDGLAGATR